MACTVLSFVRLDFIPTQLAQIKLRWFGFAARRPDKDLIGDIFFQMDWVKVFVEGIRDHRAWIDSGTGDSSVLPTHETSPHRLVMPTQPAQGECRQECK